MLSLHILEIESALEAQAIRAAAEAWGITVTVTWVGNSGQIVEYLSQQPTHDLIIISGHGDERGLLLPELAPSVRDRYPYHEAIRPDDFARFLALGGNGVLMNTCCGGQRALADVFLAHGAAWYIGTEAYPDARAALMFVLSLIYHYREARDIDQAFAQTTAIVPSEGYRLDTSS
jgi:hypothetical protein